MAFFDFLGAPVSGQVAQGPMPSGAAGVGQGMTYGDIARALLSMSQNQGSRALGNAVGQQYGSTAGLTNEQLLNQHSMLDKQKQGGTGNALLSLFSGFLGV